MKKQTLVLLIIIILSINLKTTFGQTLIITVDSVPTNVAHVCVNHLVTFGSHITNDTMLNSSFDNQSLGVGWSATSVIPLFNNPCPPLNLPASGYVCWFGGACYPRILITDSFNILSYQDSNACKIEWDMRYGANQNTANCESPDESTEGVHLQYSTSATTPYIWTQFNGEIAPSGTYGTTSYTSGSGGYWTPTAGNTAIGSYYTWNHFTTTIPTNAYSTSTRIRWYQDIPYAATFDHWGIDNVKISCKANIEVIWNCIELPGWTHSGLNPTPQLYTNVGTYHYVVILFNLNTGSTLYDTLTLYVDTAATVGTLSGPNTVTAWQSNVKYTFSNYTPGTTYTWTYPSGVDATIDSNSVTIVFKEHSQSGFVTVKSANACGVGGADSIYVMVLSGNAISEASQAAYDLKVFPNPLNNTATISYNLKNTQHLNISIYDITGRKVKELLNTKQQKGTHQLSLDASELSAATYFLQLTGDDVLNPVKFTIIH